MDFWDHPADSRLALKDTVSQKIAKYDFWTEYA
jgi:hypothetical protein